MGVKSIIAVGCIWMLMTILISFFVAATMGGRGAEIVFLFSVLPGLAGWAVHIGYVQLAKKISSFPTMQPLAIAVITLLLVSLATTIVGKPKPIYAAAAMIFMFGFIPTLISGYTAHWVLLKINRKAENA